MEDGIFDQTKRPAGGLKPRRFRTKFQTLFLKIEEMIIFMKIFKILN